MGKNVLVCQKNVSFQSNEPEMHKFAPRLECWNNGTMGFGKMGHGFIGKISFDM